VYRRVFAATVLGFTLSACVGSPTAPATNAIPSIAAAKGVKVDPGYATYESGSTVDAVTTSHLGGALLAGGGTDSDAGMKWLLAQGGTRGGVAGKYGDVVVLRTSGTNGYNKYLLNFGANSVTSIVITSATGANSAYVVNALSKAEVIFIAGGDQSTYVNLWTGTALQNTVNSRVGAGIPIGGTSAGLAVLGEFAYSALNVSTESVVALANPFDPSITFARSLFTVPQLGNVITDSHFVTRDRLGRLVTFLARLQKAYGTSPRGIGIDEKSAVGLAAGGTATVFGAGAGAYLLTTSTATTNVCLANTALAFGPVTTSHVPVGVTFNWSSWSYGTPYTLTAANGALTSSKGTAY
jgi:cyanophycinase